MDSSAPKTPEAKEVDFFAEHEELIDQQEQAPSNGTTTLATTQSQPVPIANGSNGRSSELAEEDLTGAPSVDAALSMSPTEAVKVAEPRKSTIGARKPASAKKGVSQKQLT